MEKRHQQNAEDGDFIGRGHADAVQFAAPASASLF